MEEVKEVTFKDLLEYWATTPGVRCSKCKMMVQIGDSHACDMWPSGNMPQDTE